MTATLDDVSTLPVTQWRDVIHMEVGTQLAVAGWVPERPTAIALLCHGHAEHLGRYGHVINALVADGLAVYGIDHRGHGRSTGTPALIEDVDQVARDLRVLALFAAERHTGLPTVLIGHSMRGLIALRYALLYQHTLGALVTSGPALIIDQNASRPEVIAGKALGQVAPAAPLPVSFDDGCELSNDAAICRQFTIDHRNWRGGILAGTAAAMMRCGEETRERLGEITLPILAMHGIEDTITDPRGTELIGERIASEDRTVILWEGMRHEIFNEPRRAEVIGTMRSWLAERVR